MDLSQGNYQTNDIINYSKTMELLEDVFEFKKERNFDGDMIELIISYCEENEFKIEEVGDILSQSKEFVKMFEKQAIKHNHIKIANTDNDENQMNTEDW